MASTSQPNIPDPPTLMTLPREMRDRIYYHTFVDVMNDVEESGHAARNSGILGACQQTRAEAIKPYYQLSIFWGDDSSDVKKWLRGVAKGSRAWIRQIYIDDMSSYNKDQALLVRRFQEEFAPLGVRREAWKTAFWSPRNEVEWASKLPEGFHPMDGAPVNIMVVE